MSMWIVLFAFFVLVITCALWLKEKSGTSESIAYPYERIEMMFSPAERSFLGVLEQAVGDEYRIFGKVRVADVAKVKRGLSQPASRGALNRIASKHFDFVVCDRNELKILCAIELNDKSHTTKSRKKRDELIEGICGAIALPLMQVTAKTSYSVPEIRQQVMECVSV